MYFKIGACPFLTGVFRGSPALWAGSSDTNQEINLNYREAPPCPAAGAGSSIGGEHHFIINQRAHTGYSHP
ncbi:hypothetical protein ACFL43_07525, partial [Thermodesulfobacteriota bacterium]